MQLSVNLNISIRQATRVDDHINCRILMRGSSYLRPTRHAAVSLFAQVLRKCGIARKRKVGGIKILPLVLHVNGSDGCSERRGLSFPIIG